MAKAKREQPPTVEEFVSDVEQQLGAPLQGFYAELVPAMGRALGLHSIEEHEE